MILQAHMQSGLDALMIRKLVFTTLKRRITSDEYAQLLELGSVPATNYLPIYLSIQPMQVALSWAIASTISKFGY